MSSKAGSLSESMKQATKMDAMVAILNLLGCLAVHASEKA